MNLTNEALISGLMDFLFIFIFSLLGAIVKDTYNTLIQKEPNVRIGRILISTIVSSVIMFALSDWLLGKMGWKSFVLPCFIGGLIGFDSLSKIANIQFWINLYNMNKALTTTDINIPEDKKEEKEENNKNNEN